MLWAVLMPPLHTPIHPIYTPTRPPLVFLPAAHNRASEVNVIGGGPTLGPAAPLPEAVECDAEVGNFQRAFDIDEEVFRLKVSMRDFPVVAVSETADEVHEELARSVLLQRAALGSRNVVEELAAADKLGRRGSDGGGEE